MAGRLMARLKNAGVKMLEHEYNIDEDSVWWEFKIKKPVAMKKPLPRKRIP